MTEPKPFLKWAGGKSRLLPQLGPRFPERFDSYVEPFVGGGAVLFHVLRNRPQVRRVVACDSNPHLITTYRTIKERPRQLISQLESLQQQYLPLQQQERKDFYLNRRHAFNHSRLDDASRAALFIFLNRTCFNGLYRVNRHGDFNVPHGSYQNPMICDAETLMADCRALERVLLLEGDFVSTLPHCGAGTFVYLDPPYRPSVHGGFTSYARDGFDDEDQRRLSDYYRQLHQRGCSLLLSNSDCRNADPDDCLLEQYYADFTIERVLAPRAINSDPRGRGPVSELLIRNYDI